MSLRRRILMMSGLMLVGGVVLVGSPASEAQVTKSGSKYQLRMKWSKGAKLGYNLEMKQVGGSSAPMKMGIDYVVSSVKGTSGVVDVTVKGMGQEPQKEKLTIDNRGRSTGGSTSGFGNILEFPQEAVAIGGTWKTKANLPGMGGGSMTGTATNTLKGFRTEGGKQFAHVVTDLKTTGGGVTGAGTTNTLISMSDGHIFRSSMNLKMSVSMKDSNGKPVNQSVNMAITMTRK